jgi:tRNA A37 N6-isopentenylltransferase MiaA
VCFEITAARLEAERQLIWFRKGSRIHWLCGFGEDATIAAAVEQ